MLHLVRLSALPFSISTFFPFSRHHKNTYAWHSFGSLLMLTCVPSIDAGVHSSGLKKKKKGGKKKKKKGGKKKKAKKAKSGKGDGEL